MSTPLLLDTQTIHAHVNDDRPCVFVLGDMSHGTFRPLLVDWAPSFASNAIDKLYDVHADLAGRGRRAATHFTVKHFETVDEAFTHACQEHHRLRPLLSQHPAAKGNGWPCAKDSCSALDDD